jgi:hypothetical protein
MLTFERHLACVYVESEQPSLQLLFKNLCDIIASNRISIVSRKGKHRLKFSSCNSTYCCGCCVSSLPVGGLSNALNVVKVGSRCGEMKRPHVHESVNFESFNSPKDTPKWGDRHFRRLRCCFLCSPAPRTQRQTLHGRVESALSVRSSNRSCQCDIECLH